MDGLRAIAVLSVVASHVSSHAFDPATYPGSLLHCGMHGVDLFFVISGFCLSYPTLAKIADKAEATFDVAGFATRRIVRIIPPYYAAIAVLAIAAIAAGGHIRAGDIFSQLLFLDAGGQAHMLNGSFWTLPIELRWYVFFPVLLWVFTRSKRAFFTIACLSFALGLTKAANEDLMTLPAFMLGIVAAQMYCRGFRYGGIALALFVLFGVVGYFTAPANWDNYALPAWQGAAFFLVIAAGSVDFVSRLLSNKIATGIGVASYSIYLIHEPVIDFLRRHGIEGLFAAAAGIGAGIVFWYFAERPFVYGRARSWLAGELGAFLPRWLAFAGIGAPLTLSGSRIPVKNDMTLKPTAEPAAVNALASERA